MVTSTPIASILQFSFLMLVQAVDGNDGHRYLTSQLGSYVVPVVREVTDVHVSICAATYHNYVARPAPYAVLGTAFVWDPTQEMIDLSVVGKNASAQTTCGQAALMGLSCGEILVWL